MDVLVYSWSTCIMDNPGISMDVLVYRLVHLSHGQSWVSMYVLVYSWSTCVMDNPGDIYVCSSI